MASAIQRANYHRLLRARSNRVHMNETSKADSSLALQGFARIVVLWGDANDLNDGVVTAYRASGERFVWAGPAPLTAGDIAHLECVADNPAAALAIAREVFQDQWIMLLRGGAILPPAGILRLFRVADAVPTAACVSALSNADHTLTPLPQGDRCNRQDATRLDRLVFLLGSLSYYAHPQPLATASLWRPHCPSQDQLQATNWPDLTRHLTASSTATLVCDHVYVHSPTQPLLGPPDSRPQPTVSALDAKRARVADALQRPPAALASPGLDRKPVQLHVLHSWGGGITQWVTDIASTQNDRHHLLLTAWGHPDSGQYGQELRLYAGAPSGDPIGCWPLSYPIASIEARWSPYLSIVKEIIARYCVDHIVVSSLIGHSLDILRTNLPTVVVLHDYFPSWPVLQVCFETDSGRFDRRHLERSLARPGPNQRFLDKSPRQWSAIRNAYLQALGRPSIQLVAPSASVARNLARVSRRWAKLQIAIVAHGLKAWPAHSYCYRAPQTPLNRPLRLVVPGRLSAGKGKDLLSQLIPDVAALAECYLLGAGADGHAFFAVPGVHIVLDYQRDELPKLLAAIRPDAALLLSTVSETFSYTLSEMRALGVPVVATRVGSLAERIAHQRDGWLVDPTPAAVLHLLRDLAERPAQLETVAAALSSHRPISLLDMQDRYRKLLPATERPAARYRLTTTGNRSMAIAALARDRHRLQRSLDQAQEVIQAQERELGQRASWGYDLSRQLSERSDWALGLEAERDRAHKHLEKLRTEFEERTVWAIQLQQDVESRDARIVALEATATRQATEYQTLVNSRSWRLTRPLRRIARAVRKRHQAVALQLGRFASLARRGRNSLRVRGLAGTYARLRQEWRRSMPNQPMAPIALTTHFEPIHFPLAEQPLVSIVIPAYNNYRHTYACLCSLRDHATDPPFQVIVVDDASHDETENRVSRCTGVTYLRNDENQGFIDSCNRGAAAARGRYLVFLNNDTVVTDGWLDALLATFEDHPNAGLVGAKLVYPDGRLQEAGGIVFSDGSGWNYGRFEDPLHPAYNYLREVDYCSGACVMVSRALFRQLGGFDRRYAPAYYEDTDLAFGVRQAGYSVYYQPAAVVVHFEGVTSGTDVNAGVKRYQVVNREKFLTKWAAELIAQPTPGSELAYACQHRRPRQALIIDACTPTPDQDSGSLRMTNLMRLLIELGHGVTFMADNRAYMDGYTERLQQLGVAVYYDPFIGSVEQLLAHLGHRLDIAIVSRHYVAQHYVALLRRHCPKARVLFDTVDLHYLREQRLATLANDRNQAATAQRTKQAELAVARACDLTLVVSTHEKQVLASDAPDIRVEVLSNIHAVHGCRRGYADRQHLMFLGGFQHPPNIDAVVWLVHDILPLIQARLPQARLHIIGSKAPREIRRLGGRDGVVFEGFVEDIEPFLDGCRLALAPLRYGAGVKGKINMSMSYGQPVIATAPAVEGMFVHPGQDVLVADSEADFAAAVIDAYSDQALWEKLSANGLDNVERHFSFAAARTALDRILGR